jgi:glycosyltransferase involved in cell wall biosynthesis
MSTRGRSVLVLSSKIGFDSMASGFRTMNLLNALHRAHMFPVEIDVAPSRKLKNRPWICIDLQLMHGKVGNALWRVGRFFFPHGQFVAQENLIKRSLEKHSVVPSAVYCGTPPHELQILGMNLAKAFEVPLIADFRDDWSGNHRKRMLTRFHKQYAINWEKRIVKNSCKVIVNNNAVFESFCLRYPEHVHKLRTITNGFDEAFANFETYQPDKVFKIVYAGSSYNGFLEKWFSEFHSALCLLRPDMDFKIVTMGGGWAYPAGSVVRKNWLHLGLLEAREMVKEIGAASVLFLLMPPGEKEPSPTIPLKSFSYLKSGKSVVYIGERGATTDLLGKFAGTFHLPRASGEVVAKWTSEKMGELRVQWSRIGVDEYSINELMVKLVSEISSVV